MASDVVGDGFECGAQVRDLVGEAGQGACFGLSGAVFVDDGAQLGIALEGGSADPGELGDWATSHSSHPGSATGCDSASDAPTMCSG